jgi:branched-subunit amino acid aminotransferase/4-amino-4-deoxychorismate lyase
VEERVLVRSDLAAAERVLLCNALRGVWEVEVYV